MLPSTICNLPRKAVSHGFGSAQAANRPERFRTATPGREVTISADAIGTSQGCRFSICGPQARE